jgi:hypothetical protein
MLSRIGLGFLSTADCYYILAFALQGDMVGLHLDIVCHSNPPTNTEIANVKPNLVLAYNSSLKHF